MKTALTRSVARSRPLHLYLGFLASAVVVVALGIFWPRRHEHRVAALAIERETGPMLRAASAMESASASATVPHQEADSSDLSEQALARQIPAGVVGPPARDWGTQTPAIPVQPPDPQTTRPSMTNPGGVNGARPPR
jgi:hypothetical protein